MVRGELTAAFCSSSVFEDILIDELEIVWVEACQLLRQLLKFLEFYDYYELESQVSVFLLNNPYLLL